MGGMAHISYWIALTLTQEQLDDCVIQPTWRSGRTDITDTYLANLPESGADYERSIAKYRQEHQVATARADELFRVNLSDCYTSHSQHGYYTLDSHLFPRLFYAVKPHIYGCYATVYDRIRKAHGDYQTIMKYGVGWMCIAQDVFLPESDRLLQVGLMLRDHEREVLKTAFWRGSGLRKSPLHHIKKYMAEQKRKR